MREVHRNMILALSLVLTSISCATLPDPEDWVKYGAARGEFARDRYDCMMEADALESGWSCSGYMCLFHRSPYKKYFRACMEARGWSPR